MGHPFDSNRTQEKAELAATDSRQLLLGEGHAAAALAGGTPIKGLLMDGSSEAAYSSDRSGIAPDTILQTRDWPSEV